MTDPVLFAFGLHLHQPVGNFDSVLEEHVTTVYRPLLEALRTGPLLPTTLHLSGPLLEWLERGAPDWLDSLGALVSAGHVELLLSGYDEPILAALPRADRCDQIQRMREALQRRFGVHPTGLWLTERVWEPDLAADLAASGVEYILLDDRHFLVAGFERSDLHRPFYTEAEGHRVAVFPIDERLRYLVPFRPPAEFERYLGDLRGAGHRLAVLADDGEKFGGWPGTYDWVYRRGWMRSWLDALKRLTTSGAVRPVTFSQALQAVPSGGLAYLPSASYREMEGWALPPAAARRLAALEAELGPRLSGPEGALVRGSHWRNFLVRYPEANRMHKKMLRLTQLCRARGDPPAARRAIGRAQCNDAYWHGVFGGLYLPHLRAAVWANLAEAEAILRRGEGVSWQQTDADCDGHEELLVQGPTFAAVMSPVRGGGIEELLWFDTGVNLADVLTRRYEAYHTASPSPSHTPGDEVGTPSIHQLEGRFALEELPSTDRDPRAVFQERILPGDLAQAEWSAGNWEPIRSWTRTRFAAAVEAADGGVTVLLRAPGLDKRYRFRIEGEVEVQFVWDSTGLPDGSRFCTELSLARVPELQAAGAARWRYAIETVAKSERGFERVVQGESLALLWPASLGWAVVRFRP